MESFNGKHLIYFFEFLHKKPKLRCSKCGSLKVKLLIKEHKIHECQICEHHFTL